MYINGYNRQKVMDVIKKNSQGYQAYASGECMYRTHEDEPNSCLVGCFIPDDKYDENMEGRDAVDVRQRFFLDEFMPMGDGALIQLQNFHDEELDILSGQEFFDAIEEKLVDLELLFG